MIFRRIKFITILTVFAFFLLLLSGCNAIIHRPPTGDPVYVNSKTYTGVTTYTWTFTISGFSGAHDLDVTTMALDPSGGAVTPNPVSLQ